MNLSRVFLISVALLTGSSCSVMTSVGGALEDYDNNNEGLVSNVAGIAGRVYTTVGCSGAGAGNAECEKIKSERGGASGKQ